VARTLARQFLGWQLGIVGLLLVAVTALAVVQSDAAFRETQGRRMLSVAEDVAATAGVRESLAARSFGPLPALGTSARNLSGADEIVIVDADLVVRSAADPAEVGEPFPARESTAPVGRAWVGNPDGRTVVAHVPVLADDGRVVGLVAARVEAPPLLWSGWRSCSGWPGRCCSPGGCAARPSGWSPPRSWSWCSGGRRCCSG
jgi:sensor histidine kinase regulating citrate/malate metabolism